MYSVGNLNEECYGQVTAIEYCYQYVVSGEGKAVFNWTVLILERAGTTSFRITNLYVIESHPESLSDEKCINSGDDRVQCCDVTHVTDFMLSPTVDFVFGVTGSAQGNTPGATLLGFHDTLSQYLVDTVQLSRAGFILSVGSTIPESAVARRGLRMLWFILGKLL